MIIPKTKFIVELCESLLLPDNEEALSAWRNVWRAANILDPDTLTSNPLNATGMEYGHVFTNPIFIEFLAECAVDTAKGTTMLRRLALLSLPNVPGPVIVAFRCAVEGIDVENLSRGDTLPEYVEGAKVCLKWLKLFRPF